MIQKRRKRQVFNLLMLLLFLFSCNTNDQNKITTVNLRMFSIRFDSIEQTPFILEDSFGSKGFILFDKWKDTIHFNFGYGDINSLAEKDPVVVYHPYNIDTLKSKIDPNFIDTSKVIFTNTVNYDIDEFRKQNVYFDMISGFRAKITVPREISNGGMTGVYFDSLGNDAGGRLKFNLYAIKLDSVENHKLLKAIKSIKFILK